ncbi:hypothetical protein WJX72_005916 [[Myrmecia] bisecta]|uniref:Uncharacterized protein n=1 Tax=[Myrmecia] bisecta TaxID=41462 RepID=A0AAW1R7S2_9CHLO
MGGKALTKLGISVRRLDLAAYEALKAEAVQLLQQYYRRVEAPPHLLDKTSFGDLDLLVAGPLREFDPVASTLSHGCVRNGSVLSFEYQSFQVDVITVKPEVFDLAMVTLAGEMGVVLGLLAKQAGLKLSGEKGLCIRYPCRNSLPHGALQGDDTPCKGARSLCTC